MNMTIAGSPKNDMACTKLFLKLKVLHSPVVPQLQCREVLEYHLYLWVVMEISLSFTQTVRAWHQPHTDSISPPHWPLSVPRESDTAQSYFIWGHPCLLGLWWSSTHGLHSQAWFAAAVSLHCSFAFLSCCSSKSNPAYRHSQEVNPRCSRVVWETRWVPFTVLVTVEGSWQAIHLKWAEWLLAGVPCRGWQRDSVEMFIVLLSSCYPLSLSAHKGIYQHSMPAIFLDLAWQPKPPSDERADRFLHISAAFYSLCQGE